MRAIAIILVAFAAVIAAQTPASEKVIKDPAEYNAYMTALNDTNPAEKAALMEAFAQKYPASVVNVDALEQAMAAYQQTGNLAKVKEMSSRILDLEPGHIRALAIQTALTRNDATQGNADAARKLASLAERGLKALPEWHKPEEMSDDDFAKLTRQMESIFNGGAGFVALQNKDYAAARDFYLKSVAVDSTDLQNTYQLSIAELEMTPLDPNGFWYAARAVNLAKGNAAGEDSIRKYAGAKYKRYHGGTDGWDEIVSKAATQPSLPDNFATSIKRAPTPAELAVQAVQENDPSSLSFSDWEYVLSYRDASAENKAAADKVWQALREKEKNGEARLRLPVKIISATENTIQAALTDENRDANKPDLEVTMLKPLRTIPAAGSEAELIGVIEDYRLNPVVFIMVKGELVPKNGSPVTSRPGGGQN